MMETFKTRALLTTLLLSLVLASCADGPDAPLAPGSGEEGWQTLRFGGETSDRIEIQTRSSLNSAAESRIINLLVLVFDDGGHIIYRHFFDSDERRQSLGELVGPEHLWYVDELDPESTVPERRGFTHGAAKIRCPNVTGGSMHIFANIDDDLYNLSYSTSSTIQTEEEVLAEVLEFQDPTISRMGNFLMRGRAPVNVQGTVITFGQGPGSDYSQSQGGPGNVLLMERVDSKIEFKVGVVPGSGVISFEPASWQVFNLPKGCSLIEKSADAPGEDFGGWFDGPQLSFETKRSATYQAQGGSTSRTEHGFSFYMLENRRSADKKASTGGDYHLRDKRRKDASGIYEDGELWEYAPEHSTFVRFEGNILLEEDDCEFHHKMGARAVYYVHLGDFAASTDNYDIERNCHYTYTIDISGVDKIRVEVERDKELGFLPGNEEQSGATGDVIESYEDIHVFDSHYDQRVFCINAPSIIAQSEGDINNLTWYVRSPYGHSGMPEKVGAGMVDAPNGLDYKWVSFLVNKKSATYTEPHGSPDGGPRVVTNPNFPNYCQYNRIWPEGGKDNPELMDVVSLCDYLRRQIRAYEAGEESDFDSQGDIWITAFVDEFYYDIDPISGDRRYSLWREFVNQEERSMHIMCNSAVSKDGESALIRSAVSFRQLPIQTIYDTIDAEEGWGTETIDEAGRMLWFFKTTEDRTAGSRQRNYFESDVYNRSLKNGFYNSGQMWGLVRGGASTADGTAKGTFQSGKAWAERLDFVKPNDSPTGFLRDEETSATLRYTCLARNRDRNGNGLIERDEIDWYMASLGQLQNLFIGDLALSFQARLYNLEDRGAGSSGIAGNNYHLWRNHVVSSTAINPGNTGDNNYRPAFLWSEEGISYSAYAMDNQWSKPGWYSARCVRNLERDFRSPHDITDPQDFPEQVVKVEKNLEDGSFTFDFTLLNSVAKRPKTATELLPLDQYSAMSSVANRFQTGPLGDGGNSHNMADYITIQKELEKGTSRCPSGYRMPNVREMVAAYLYIPSNDSFWGNGFYYMVANYYSFGRTVTGGNGYDSVGDGGYSWGFARDNITVTPTNGKIYIRCVRDL